MWAPFPGSALLETGLRSWLAVGVPVRQEPAEGACDEVQKIVRMAAMAVLDAQIRDGSTLSPEARALVIS